MQRSTMLATLALSLLDGALALPHSSPIRVSPILKTRQDEPSCGLDGLTVPFELTAPPLDAPNGALTLATIVIGRGVQNYTCPAPASADGNATAPVANGAIAILYDASCACESSADILAKFATGALPLDLPADAFAPLDIDGVSLPRLGHHFFDAAKTPVFDFSEADTPEDDLPDDNLPEDDLPEDDPPSPPEATASPPPPPEATAGPPAPPPRPSGAPGGPPRPSNAPANPPRPGPPTLRPVVRSPPRSRPGPGPRSTSPLTRRQARPIGVGRMKLSLRADAPVDAAANVPWLLLGAATGDEGQAIQAIYRVETRGGVVNGVDCEGKAEGEEVSVQYASEYWVFVGA